MTERKLRILVAEESPGEARTALRTLYPDTDGRLEPTDVGSLSTLLPTISMAIPDAVLLDLKLARRDAVDAVRRIRRAAANVPLIVLADASHKDEARQCLDVGAIDYLLKDFMDARTVDRALRTALEHNTLGAFTDLMRDPLTNLYTREGLLTRGTHALATARRNGGTLVLLCALLENLASLRQKRGAGTTEHTLRELAGLLSANFRRTDVVARMGESQFAALAVDAAEPSAPVLCQRVRRRIDAFNQLRDRASAIQLRMAVGFWSAQDAGGFEELLDQVEAELRSGSSAPPREVNQPANVARG